MDALLSLLASGDTSAALMVLDDITGSLNKHTEVVCDGGGGEGCWGGGDGVWSGVL